MDSLAIGRRKRQLKIGLAVVALLLPLFGFWAYQETSIAWATSRHELVAAQATMVGSSTYQVGGEDGETSTTAYRVKLQVHDTVTRIDNAPDAVYAAASEHSVLPVQTWHNNVIVVGSTPVHDWLGTWHCFAVVGLYPVLLLALLGLLALGILRWRGRWGQSRSVHGVMPGALAGWIAAMAMLIVMRLTGLTFGWLLVVSLVVAVAVMLPILWRRTLSPQLDGPRAYSAADEAAPLA